MIFLHSLGFPFVQKLKVSLILGEHNIILYVNTQTQKRSVGQQTRYQHRSRRNRSIRVDRCCNQVNRKLKTRNVLCVSCRFVIITFVLKTPMSSGKTTTDSASTMTVFRFGTFAYFLLMRRGQHHHKTKLSPDN